MRSLRLRTSVVSGIALLAWPAMAAAQMAPARHVGGSAQVSVQVAAHGGNPAEGAARRAPYGAMGGGWGRPYGPADWTASIMVGLFPDGICSPARYWRAVDRIRAREMRWERVHAWDPGFRWEVARRRAFMRRRLADLQYRCGAYGWNRDRAYQDYRGGRAGWGIGIGGLPGAILGGIILSGGRHEDRGHAAYRQNDGRRGGSWQRGSGRAGRGGARARGRDNNRRDQQWQQLHRQKGGHGRGHGHGHGRGH